jgi:hypothetical protein
MALLLSLIRQASPEQHQQNNINPLSDCSVSDLALLSCMYASISFVQIHSCVKQMSASWTWIAVARKQGFLIKLEVYWQCKKDVHISLSLSLSLSLILPNPSTLHFWAYGTKAFKCLEVYTNTIYGDFKNLKQLEHIIETELCRYFMDRM